MREAVQSLVTLWAELHELEQAYEPFSPDSDLLMTQELIANMLGVRREGVTEGALKLQKAGLIRVDSTVAWIVPEEAH